MITPGPGARSKEVLAGSGLSAGEAWQAALAQALDEALESLAGQPPDLVVVFASATYNASYRSMLAEVGRRTSAHHVVGCSASAVIGREQEVEDVPAVAVLALRLPSGSVVEVRHVRSDGPRVAFGDVLKTQTPGLVVLADPFSTDVDQLVTDLERDYPGVPVMGGLATGQPGWRHTFLFCDGDVLDDGAVVVALGGATRVRPVVSQGCEPIGQAWTITAADGHVVSAIGGRPAYQVLMETVRGLDQARRQRVNGNLLIGLAMDEYRDEFKRGDFLIRNLVGVDPKSNAIAVAAQVKVGQTLQFQIRDARAADEELRHMLSVVRSDDDTPAAAAALLFACNGRGVSLFGAPHHDARMVNDVLGPLPIAGLFCNGEIGPVGPKTFVHGFTASLALISAAEQAQPLGGTATSESRPPFEIYEPRS